MEEFDVFICHATEDKAEIAEPLAHALRNMGLKVWYDAFMLTVGDSLRKSIDQGLARCRYGIVILSPDFFAKRWPQIELDGLASREAAEGGKIILPLWHRVNGAQVEAFSPILAGRLAVSTEGGLPAVLRELVRVLPVAKGSVTSSPSPLTVRIDFRRIDAGGGRLHTDELLVVLESTGACTVDRFTVEIQFPRPFLRSPTLIEFENVVRSTRTHRLFCIPSTSLGSEVPLFPGRSITLPRIQYQIDEDLDDALARGNLRRAVVRVCVYLDGREPLVVDRPMSELHDF